MAKFAVTKSVTAQNTFSDKVKLHGQYNISISGTFVATVVVQRSFDDGSNWHNVDSSTVPIQTFGTEPEDDIVYRIGVETGGYTSGTVVGRLSQ
ncbi:hypothetical protein LCGC14_0893920 [marine sediment metagenome]|uniref:Uncharacterized protein n=1 Tax=marine sediment metagenome TaxID=412755 RepID=A0A0F9NYF2_9ZZZZ